jgi:predicted dehydrogenase
LKSPVKIGLIGCGRAAELIYTPALKKYSEVEVVLVVDPMKERLELLGNNFQGCTKYNSLDESLIEKIDAGIILTPPDTHIILSSALLKRNKYVLVEKPLALSMNGIKELIEIERASTASLMMGFNHRHWRPVINLREKLSKDIKVNSSEIIFTGNYSSWNPVSFTSDPLNDLGPHLFDLVRFIFNKEIVSVSAIEPDKSNYNVKIKIAGNIIINCRIAHSDKTEKSFKLFTVEEKYFITLSSTRIRPQSGPERNLLDLKDMAIRKLLRKTSPIKKTYEVQLNKFFSFVRSNSTADPGIKDGVKAISAVEAARLSINRNGKEIFLDETE